MATQNQINEYLTNVRTTYVEYAGKLSDAQRLGRTDLECYKLEFRILKYLVRIMTDYFNSDDYTTNNFFTKSEARDVMQKINSICGTTYMIEL